MGLERKWCRCAPGVMTERLPVQITDDSDQRGAGLPFQQNNLRGIWRVQFYTLFMSAQESQYHLCALLPSHQYSHLTLSGFSGILPDNHHVRGLVSIPR